MCLSQCRWGSILDCSGYDVGTIVAGFWEMAQEGYYDGPCFALLFQTTLNWSPVANAGNLFVDVWDDVLVAYAS